MNEMSLLYHDNRYLLAIHRAFPRRACKITRINELRRDLNFFPEETIDHITIAILIGPRFNSKAVSILAAIARETRYDTAL